MNFSAFEDDTNRIVQTPHWMMSEHEKKRKEQEDDYTVVTDREDWD